MSLNLGGKLKWPINRELRVGIYGEEWCPQQRKNELSVELKTWYEHARKYIQQQQRSLKKEYDKRRRAATLLAGTLVLLHAYLLSSKENNFLAKLAKTWEGPEPGHTS